MQKSIPAPFVLSVLALVLLVTNFALVLSNRSTQKELAKRQEIVMQNQPIVQLGQAVAKMAFDAASKGDTQMRSALTTAGIPLPDQAAKK